MLTARKTEIIAGLQSEIIRLQGFKSSTTNTLLDGFLGPISSAFPGSQFPVGAVHEFMSAQTEDAASSCGFLVGMISSLMRDQGAVLWISTSRTLFPPALKNFSVAPDHFVFIDVKKEKEVLWAMEEALKCSALSAVVCEIREISFTESRRLQLAVEQSMVTGFILRNNYRQLNTTACVSRWKITSLPSAPIEELPGIGLPAWKVELLRVRNGNPGTWHIQWANGKFEPISSLPPISIVHQRKAG